MLLYKKYNKTPIGQQGGVVEWQEIDDEITITNRDPSLAVSVDGDYEIYCMCMRINREWRVVYISCDSLSQ